MSDTKHTPGPWRFFDNAGKNMQGYCQPSGVTGTGENLGQLVCGCFGDVRGGEDQAKANARLIAAAPELLGALKKAERIIQKLAGWSGNDLSELDSEFGYHAIPEAIAKATQP